MNDKLVLVAPRREIGSISCTARTLGYNVLTAGGVNAASLPSMLDVPVTDLEGYEEHVAKYLLKTWGEMTSNNERTICIVESLGQAPRTGTNCLMPVNRRMCHYTTPRIEDLYTLAFWTRASVDWITNDRHNVVCYPHNLGEKGLFGSISPSLHEVALIVGDLETISQEIKNLGLPKFAKVSIDDEDARKLHHVHNMVEVGALCYSRLVALTNAPRYQMFDDEGKRIIGRLKHMLSSTFRSIYSK